MIEDNAKQAVRDERIIMSPTIGKITAALVEAQKTIKPIGKAGEVDYEFNGKRTNYKYALYTDMWEMAHKALGDNGLDFSVLPMGDKVIGLMKHVSGEFLGGFLDIKQTVNKYNKFEATDTGEWVTYLSKYLYKAALNLPTDDNEMLSVAKNMAAVEKQADKKDKDTADDTMYKGLATANGIKVQGIDSIDDIGMKVELVKAFLKENELETADKIRTKGKPEVLKLLRGEI